MTSETASGNASRVAATNIYEILTGDEDARVCKDIPDSACDAQPVSFTLQLIAQVLTKIGDGLMDVKVVLAWLMSAVGAPGAAISLIAPLRESLSMAPQLIVAAFIRRRPVRKWFWVVGAVLQGIAVFATATVFLTLEGATAGWSVVGLVILFSLSRGICSIAAKDVLGKTVSRGRRGTLSGYATSASAFVILAFGIWLNLTGDGRSVTILSQALIISAALWLAGAVVYALLPEAPGSTGGGGNAAAVAIESLKLVFDDPDFGKFVLSRALLLGTALSGPYFAVLAQSSGVDGLQGLGGLMVGSALAGALSAPVWGRLSDVSSRLVMVAGGMMAGLTGIAIGLLDLSNSVLLTSPYSFAVAVFILGLGHAGVRLGRKTYVVDIATSDTRSSYVAVSNTIIGLVLLAIGGISALVASLSIAYALLMLSAMAIAGAALSLSLKEVEE
ncbi:MFS transporter [Alphaproteobacteria bacterium HT1-32]|nr:MFS transporter [Alphaproteobacteria bacterium HT1-32]